MDIIDNFLREYGLVNPSFSSATTKNLGAHGLALIGSRISASKLSELDDEVLSTISNEILRFNSTKK